ncbi:hypothetical protein VitviT2T_022823 [Vitis vinifera]|nr:hypothetical protein VitviT2T_022823 [Vitis vinifera]
MANPTARVAADVNQAYVLSTKGIRGGPVSSLHLFEKPADLNTGSATKVVCYWYIENVEKDISGAGILFAPVHKCFKGTRPVGGYFAESVTDLRELQSYLVDDNVKSDVLEYEVKVCDICGDAGLEELLSTYTQCNEGGAQQQPDVTG